MPRVINVRWVADANPPRLLDDHANLLMAWDNGLISIVQIARSNKLLQRQVLMLFPSRIVKILRVPFSRLLFIVFPARQFQA